MESMREMLEKLEKLNKMLDAKNETLEKLQKLLDAKKELLEKRNEILTRMMADLETEGTPSNERTNRFEGYYSYIISYKLEDLIEERNWFGGVILSAAILEDVGKRKLKRAFKGKIDSEKIERLTIEQTIMMLLASGLVDAITYHKLLDIKKVRNDLAHDQAMSAFLQTGSTKSKSCQKWKSAIKEAVFCLKTINPPTTPQT